MLALYFLYRIVYNVAGFWKLERSIKMIGSTSILVVFVVGIVVFIGIIVAAEFSKRYKSGDENPSPEIKFGEKIWNTSKHPAFFIAIGIVMVNWLVWALSHDFWNSLWANQPRFWALNISGWIAPCLILIKDEETKKTHTIAKAFAKIIGVLALAILAIGLSSYLGLRQKWSNWVAGKLTTPPNQQFAVGIDQILMEICNAESGGRQFEEDGKTPLKGKEDSDDTGICQINKRIWKEEIAKSRIDIGASAEENKLFAKRLYLQYGAGPWLKSMHRWGSKIGEPVWGKFFLTPEKWVEFELPKAGGHTTPDGGGKRYILRYNEEIEEEMPRTAGSSKRPPLVTKLGFKAIEENMVMTIIFSPLVPTTAAAR